MRRVECGKVHTLDVINSALQWETERQNHLHQQALEQKKKQTREEVRKNPPVVGADRIAAASPTPAATASTGSSVWPDKVRQIPDMRSALIPLDGEAEGGDWSKPFSLLKADMEPWLSFLEGYGQSRLFLGARAGAGVQLDFAVRALLELKGLSPSLILEPPVQINRQVEYCDLDLEAMGARDRGDMLLKLAQETHAKQLAKAVEQGRQLGDRLYDAMMGEGYAYLIKAWERKHGRKPSVDELHMMLSAGRVKVERRRLVATPLIPPEEQSVVQQAVSALPRKKPEAPVALPQSQTPPAAPVMQRMPAHAIIESDSEDAHVRIGVGPKTAKEQRLAKPKLWHKLGWYLLHGVATAGSAAAITYFWLQ